MYKPPKKPFDVRYKAPFQKLVNEKLKAQKPVKKVSVFKPSGKR